MRGCWKAFVTCRTIIQDMCFHLLNKEINYFLVFLLQGTALHFFLQGTCVTALFFCVHFDPNKYFTSKFWN